MLIKTNVLELKIGDFVHYRGKRRITSIEKPYSHIRIIGLDNKLFVRFMIDKSMNKYKECQDGLR